MYLDRFRPHPAAFDRRITGAALLLVIAAAAHAKSPFLVKGQYVEGCSCAAPCPCEMTGLMNGCEGLNAMSISSGSYRGVSLAGTKIALATTPGKWVRAYVDARSPRQAEAARAFAKTAFAQFGKVEFVRDARVDFQGSGGRYRVLVNGGKTLKLTTTPVLGGDRKTAIVHSNIADPLNHTFYQGKTIMGSYSDGEKHIELKDSNAYFNARMSSRGRA